MWACGIQTVDHMRSMWTTARAGAQPAYGAAKPAYGGRARGPTLPTPGPPDGRMKSASLLLAVTFVVLTATGCASLGKPQWLEPGPARNQQRKAVRFDPYMQNDIGPYAFRQYGIMDGSRPRDYAEPVPEVRRSRWWSQPLQ